MKSALVLICGLLFSATLFAAGVSVHAKRVCDAYPSDSCVCEIDDNVIKIMKEVAKASGATSITVNTQVFYYQAQGVTYQKADYNFMDRDGNINFSFIPLRDSDCEIGAYAVSGHDTGKIIPLD